MNRRSLGTLIAVNFVLLIALAVVTLPPAPAEAQLRGKGEYAMVSGNVRGRSNQDAVYVVDTRRGRVASFVYEVVNDRFIRAGVYDFAADLSRRLDARR